MQEYSLGKNMAEKIEKGFWDFDGAAIWQRFKVPISMVMIGLILVGVGVLSLLVFQQKRTEITLYPVEETQERSTIFIDLQGAVMKPGLYEMPVGSRVNDLLIRAGGLSAEADREWVSFNINLAQLLSDGVKLIIPREGESGEIAGAADSQSLRININTAGLSQLDSLYGIGEKRANDIIGHRPYASTEELVEKKIIPASIYERIKDQLTVF